ncbi:MAG: MBL fold metallo-hydrolase [Planctomycetia bacterium]
MHLQVLSSGSEGNSTLVRGGECTLLVDAGLPRIALDERFAAAGLGHEPFDHVLVTHGHLDHARSVGLVARRSRATLHAADAQLSHPWARRAKQLASLRVDGRFELRARSHQDAIEVESVLLPHDCDPTVAFAFLHGGRKAVILTDLGRPDPDIAKRLHDPHVLVLEFNWDPERMRCGPYPPMLQRRITGGRGHLSNEQAGLMLERLAGPNLHTLLIAHISQKTNLPQLALECAQRTLQRLGLHHVRVLLTEQHRILPAIEV